MTAMAKPGTEDGVPRFAGAWVLRVCCGVVALLLVGAIVYGLAMAIANYDQVAV
jgi:hypothetical protein